MSHLRFAIADRLCRLATWLRGQKSREVHYYFGNRAAELHTRLTLKHWDDDDTLDLVAELAELARATWWHDNARYDREHAKP